MDDQIPANKDLHEVQDQAEEAADEKIKRGQKFSRYQLPFPLVLRIRKMRKRIRINCDAHFVALLKGILK